MVAQILVALDAVAGLVGVEHALQRRLGVDDHVLAAGEVDHHVGAQRRLVPGVGVLLDEVAVLEHPGRLYHIAQLHLAPLAAGVGFAQCGDERAGLGAQAIAGLGQRAQLRAHLAPRLAAFLVEAQQLTVDPAQLLLERSHQLLDRRVALL